MGNKTCWFCGNKIGDLLYSTEFNCYFHDYCCVELLLLNNEARKIWFEHDGFRKEEEADELKDHIDYILDKIEYWNLEKATNDRMYSIGCSNAFYAALGNAKGLLIERDYHNKKYLYYTEED